MKIQSITIRNFGGIDTYSAALTPGNNLLDTAFAPELMAAIGFLLCSKATEPVPPDWLRPDTFLSAEIGQYTVSAFPGDGQLQLAATAEGRDDTARYRYGATHCLEQDDMELFDGRDRTVPWRLFCYRYPEDACRLSGRTDRMAETQTFRSYLCRYIRNFQPEPVNCGKNYYTTVDDRGRFRVFHPDVEGEIPLSETEEKLFLYSCFLNIAEFWGDMESLRNLHHEKKPLLVWDFLEFLDESTDIRNLIRRTLKLRRQVILLTPPLSKEAKENWMEKING